MEEQNYKNHTRLVPLFLFGVLLPLLANVLWSAYTLWQAFSAGALVGLALSVILLLMAISLRTQILTVQDRLIRLEMRLRMRESLPADLAQRASALPVKQLVALRFASDGELPGLLSEVLGGALESQKDIKLRIKNWQADHLRA